MTIALIDNGSLAPAAHRNLRMLAAALSQRVGAHVHAVSWKHSDRIRAESLDGVQAHTLARWLTARVSHGADHFLFIPFFVSPQGAIGSALRSDLEQLQQILPRFRFEFTGSLVKDNDCSALVEIVVDRIRETIAQKDLQKPRVIVVDHGGPSPASGALRDEVASAGRRALGSEISELAAASMEGEEHPHNHPLFADLLGCPRFNAGDVLIAPLFLAPGRHAGPDGDLAVMAKNAEAHAGGALRCHFAELVGTHHRVLDLLAAELAHVLRGSSREASRSSNASPFPTSISLHELHA